MIIESEPKGARWSGCHMSASLGSWMSFPALERQCCRTESISPPLGWWVCLSCWPSAGNWAWIASLVKIEHKTLRVSEHDSTCSYQLVILDFPSPSGSFPLILGVHHPFHPQGPVMPSKKMAKVRHQTSIIVLSTAEMGWNSEWTDILLKLREHWGKTNMYRNYKSIRLMKDRFLYVSLVYNLSQTVRHDQVKQRLHLLKWWRKYCLFQSIFASVRQA